ncbi:34655_t:CDS:2, partial [Racocetra persica]
TSGSKKRFSQNIDSMDDDEQVDSSSNLKVKRAKYSCDKNTTDDGITDSEYETLVQPSKSKKSSDLCFKLKRTEDGVPTYSFGPRVQQYWSCDMIRLLMDCIEANVDVFWKNPTMFWDWLATNVFTNRTPFAIAQKFYDLRPDKHAKGLRALKKLKKKSDTQLIEKIERCFQRLYEKKTWSRDRDMNVTFKYPPEYDPEQILSENTITKPLPAISLKIDESDLNFAKHLLKYNYSDDVYALNKFSGASDKIRWPELIENLGREPQKYEPFDWTDQEENSDSITISEETSDSMTVSKNANASIALLPDDKLKFELFNQSSTRKYNLMEQEVKYIVNTLNSLNEKQKRPQPPAPDPKKRSQPPDSITFAVEDALRKILDAIGSLHQTVIQDTTQSFTTEHVNSEDYISNEPTIKISNEPTIKWDTILRAANIAGLPHRYYKLIVIRNSIKEMRIGEFEDLNNQPYLDGHAQLSIWDTEVE